MRFMPPPHMRSQSRQLNRPYMKTNKLHATQPSSAGPKVQPATKHDPHPSSGGTTTAGTMTDIHEAAANSDLKTVESLLKDNPSLVFSKDTKGWTPLHYAALRGHKDVVELLLAKGANVNATNNFGMTPLHEVAFYGKMDGRPRG